MVFPYTGNAQYPQNDRLPLFTLCLMEAKKGFHSVKNDSWSAFPWKYDPEQMIRTFLKTPVVFSGFSRRVARIFPEVRPTFSTKSGNLYEAKRTKRGWVSLMVSFWASSPHCFCVFLHNYLSFALFCSFFLRWNKLKLKPSIFPLEIIDRVKKMKNPMIYWPQGLLRSGLLVRCHLVPENRKKRL